MDSHKVGIKLTVGVGENSSQFGDQLCRTILTQKTGVILASSRGTALGEQTASFYFVGPQEEPLGVVVVGVDVVPDDRSSPQDR